MHLAYFSPAATDARFTSPDPAPAEMREDPQAAIGITDAVAASTISTLKPFTLAIASVLADDT